jgi:hypothetical protein
MGLASFLVFCPLVFLIVFFISFFFNIELVVKWNSWFIFYIYFLQGHRESQINIFFRVGARFCKHQILS